MPIYDLRILLETVEGKKTSYYSSGSKFLPNNFINTTTDGNVMSASMVRDRVTRMVSASYQNESTFTYTGTQRGEVVNGGDGSSPNYFSGNTLLSATLSGSANTGSIVFTALDNEYDRLLRYKFIGEKVTNVLGLPSDQWIYVDQVRLPADDEANIFQGNANLGNVVITDTLTFAGGSDVNSDVPFLIDTGSDRYIKFVDERATSVVALRMGYDVDTDTYEISGSDDFNFNIGGINQIDGNVTASDEFLFQKNVDGGNHKITIFNSNTDNGTDKGAGIEFKHATNALPSMKSAGKIIAGKDNTYQVAGGVGHQDSNLQFFTTLNGTDTERLRITSDGEARFTGNISASGNIITEGDIIAQNYIVQSTVTQITTSFSSGSNIFGDTPADDTHQFTGSVSISGSGNDLIVDRTGSFGKVAIGTSTAAKNMELTVFGDISASGNVHMQLGNYLLLNSPVVGDDRIFYASAGGINIDSNEGTSVYNNLRVNTLGDSGKALTVDGSISGSDLYLATGSNPLIKLNRVGSSQNVGIQFENTQGYMIAGIDNDAQNDGANVFGIGYVGDLVDSDGTNNATFIVTGSQVVINNATSASVGVALTVGGELHTTSHITSSGNILASSEDARIRVQATTGNHPGFEWLEAGSRKWILYNDPDSSQGGNDNLTWKNASDTELMELDQDGMLYVSSKIIHLDDTDTFINFTGDDINIQAGGVNFIDITEGSTNEITFNEAGVDIDFRVEGTSSANLFFTDAGNDKVGIGTNAPPKKLTVAGAISASQNIFIGSGTGTDERKIIHSGDEDTYLLFDQNKVNLVAGGKSAIKYDASDGKILINNTNADVDFQVMGYGGDEILHVDAAKHSVGIGTTTPPASGSNGHLFVVAGDISASGDLFKTKFVQMTNSSSVIDTFNTGSFRSAKYTLQVTSASNFQVSELLVLHHNSTASNTEYAQINSGLNLIDFTTDISNSDVRLNAAGSFISCSVRLDRTIIPT